MKNMWRASVWLIALGVAMFTTYSAMAEDKQKQVNLYSASKEHLIRPILEVFEKETGIKVNVTNIGSSAMTARLDLEGKDTQADAVIVVDVANLYHLQEKGLLQPIESAVLIKNIPSNLRDNDNHWFGFTTRSRVIFYAKDRVNPDEIKSYADLVDPKWKGRILVRSSDNTYNQSLLASMIAHDGKEKALAWAKGVVANFARAPEGGDRDQLRAAASGVGDIVITNTYYYARMLHGEDEKDREYAEKLGVIFPNQNSYGAHVNIRGGGVTKYAKHKDEAVQLMEFLSSEEAQSFFAKDNFEFPVKPDVKWPQSLSVWGGAKFDALPLTQVGENNAEAVKLFDEANWP